MSDHDAQVKFKRNAAVKYVKNIIVTFRSKERRGVRIYM